MATSKQLKNFTQQAVNVFRDCSLIPTLSRARIVPRKGGCYEVKATWSQRDLERGRNVAFTESYFVRRTSGNILEKICNSTFPANATQILKISYSCDYSVKAILVTDKTAKAELYTKAQQYIEVWSQNKLSKTIDVKSLKRHGPINEDIHFGSFQLSADGSYLLYIAEREKPESCSFFKKPSDQESGKDAPIQGTEYVYETSWGEQLSSVVNPLPVVLNLYTEECTVLDTFQVGDISCGQAQWVPGDDGGVVFVGWENKPRKLGLVYCPTRRSTLYYWKKGEFKRLTDGVQSIFSPRFNPQGDRLIYFESVTGWAHHTCAALKMIEWDSKAVTTVIDIVKRPQSLLDIYIVDHACQLTHAMDFSMDPGSFAGYYAELLPERCWDSTGRKVVSEENWGSAKVVMCTDVDRKKVTKITSATDKPGTWSVLDVSDNVIVAGYSSPTSAPQLLIGILPDDTAAPMIWTTLSKSESNPIFSDLSWELLYFHPDGPSGLHYEAILLSPKSSPYGAAPPLAVVPHGGPNDIYSTQFSVWPTCLAALGFAVLQVNYRGSTGLGQDSIDSLPGKDGTQDVGDVHAAVLSLVDKGIINKNAVVAFGISHGGFLTTQLVVQYPDFYKAASVHNPVENFATMSGTSDIPDWCYVQAGVKYDPTLPPTSKDYTELLSHSPMSGCDKIKVPVLIHLGSEDLRVPNSQGMSLYHMLKARNVETKLLLYPGDCHPINSVSSDSDSFVNTALWFFSHSLKTEE